MPEILHISKEQNNTKGIIMAAILFGEQMPKDRTIKDMDGPFIDKETKDSMYKIYTTDRDL